MHQHYPESAHAHPRLEGWSGSFCSHDSPASTDVPPIRSKACGPWTLFSLDEELEDEDFLSAVEDAENQLAGVLPGPVGCLSPTSSCPQAAVQIPYPRPPALRPSAALAARRQSAPELCRTDHSTPSAAGDALRPCLTSCSWSDGQGPDWPGGAWEGPAQDELDQVLAGLELDLGASAGDPPPAKRARVSDLSGLTSHPEAASPLQEPRETAGPHRTPQLLLRPGATWAAANPPGHIPQPCGTSVPPDHCNPQSPGPWQPYLPPQTWAGNKPGPPGPQAPGTHSCAVSLGTSPAVSSISTPRGPRTSLQTPVVTNHLVQLVTATTRTPARAQTRRFPGPAGLLPQQHDQKDLEEIMVSTPQTPAHGAVAKPRTEAVVTSTQTPVEEDFGRGPWLAMKAALGLDDGDPTCFLRTCSVAVVLQKAALRQLPGNKVPAMAVMVQSLMRSSVDASVVLRDPTGAMQGTVHRALLEARGGELKPGAVLLLRQVGVFSPSLRSHYLNVTPSNLVHIYSPDSGDRDPLRAPQPIPKGPGSPQGRHQLHVATQSRAGLGSLGPPEEEAPESGLSRDPAPLQALRLWMEDKEMTWMDS
ncbi:homologous recombination OB-fold protein isoform X2 [Cavia porcellus]|uniref:homologous recombination OB-fold protein isoform X2 n=1 Tax=Cavia porcellus TaxID=10141 RepID=UPI002FE0DE0B